jgi:hypothetical protein
MKSITFYGVLLITALALGDFVLNTLPMLQSRRQLQTDLEEIYEQGWQRLQARGAPAAIDDVLQLESLQRTLLDLEQQELRSFFAESRQPLDYWLPKEERGQPHSEEQLKQLLDQRRVSLGLQLRAWPVLNAEDLGLDLEGTTNPAGGRPLLDRIERLLSAQWLLRCFRSSTELEVRRVGMLRPSSELQIDVRVATTLAELPALVERMLAPSEDLPCRELKSYRIRRLEPSDWGLSVTSFSSPPLEIELQLAVRPLPKPVDS